MGITVPYRFQLDDVRSMHRWNGRALYAADMGLGKTLVSLLYAYRHPEIRPIVIVCPATIKWSWQLQATQHIGMRSEVLEGTKPKERGFPTEAPMYIVNYDILGKTRNGPGWINWLKRQKPKLVVLDEIHMIGEPKSLRSKACEQLCEGVPHVIGLSGTPLINRPIELWFPLHIIKPELFPSRWSFCQEFCDPKRTFYGWDFRGASNLEELNVILIDPKNGVMLRRKKEDVLPQLPRRQRTMVPIDISDRSQYNKAVNDFMGWLHEHAPDKMHKAIRAKALVHLGYLKRLIGELKLRSEIAWLNNFLVESEEKLIVFAIHKKVIQKLKQEYQEICVVVDGSVTGKNRQLAVEKFLKDSSTRLMFGNIDAAGVGWSAKGVSKTAFAEYPWAPGKIEQAIDRTHGLGRGVKGMRSQTFFLVAKNTIEEKLLALLQRKARNISIVLDGGKMVDQFNIHDLLIEELQKGDYNG